MSVSEATGDLFDPEFGFDVIGHGVNCMGAMGSGIAVPFRQRNPEMFKQYSVMCMRGILLPGMVMPWKPKTGPVIFNIASQYRTGKDAHLDYLEMGLLYCRFYMRMEGLKHLGLPRIGAGIGGLDWNAVKHIVEDLFGDDEEIHVTLVSLEGA